jgi:hypothetical protein
MLQAITSQDLIELHDRIFAGHCPEEQMPLA